MSERAMPATTGAPTKRMTFDLDADLHKRFKALCAGHDLVMADEIRRAIEQRVNELASA